ncbi:MAG: IPTL-CTERM sorting domain-containing protein [Acidobacteriota bacterium]
MKTHIEKRVSVVFASLLLASVLARPAGAQSVLVDFENFPGPDGAFGTADDIPAPPCPGGICGPLSNEFSSFGMTFSSGTLGTIPLFPGAPVTNHYITSTPPDATFTRPVAGISTTSYSLWTATLYALDAKGAILASDTLEHPSPGSFFFLGTLSVSTTEPIARFAILPAGCSIGEPCSPILNLDDLTLTAPVPSVIEVPTLSEWGLAGLAALLAAVGGLTLRRRFSV